MWCDFFCCVMSRSALRCHVMSSHVMWWAVRSYEFVMRCGWLRCHVVVRSDDLVIRTTQIYSVLHSTTKHYSGTTLYYTVLLQYYSVLQSTTPVLLRTTKYYSSTTLYYKVLLQYYSVLQSTTPVLLCTTQIYSSTTLYYRVLPQYYSVLQSTTPVLLLVLQSTHLQGAEHQLPPTSLKCCACHAQWLSWLILVTYETSLTMRRATGLILQRHQILHLPRKMTLMSDVRHIWNVIYNARSNRHHPPTSPNAVPATKN